MPPQHCRETGGCSEPTYLMAQECWLAARVPRSVRLAREASLRSPHFPLTLISSSQRYSHPALTIPYPLLHTTRSQDLIFLPPPFTGTCRHLATRLVPSLLTANERRRQGGIQLPMCWRRASRAQLSVTLEEHRAFLKTPSTAARPHPPHPPP